MPAYITGVLILQHNAALVPTYYNNAICLHTYITMPYAYTLIYSFPAWKKAFQHIYSFPQKTATMSETYR